MYIVPAIALRPGRHPPGTRLMAAGGTDRARTLEVVGVCCSGRSLNGTPPEVSLDKLPLGGTGAGRRRNDIPTVPLWGWCEETGW